MITYICSTIGVNYLYHRKRRKKNEKLTLVNAVFLTIILISSIFTFCFGSYADELDIQSNNWWNLDWMYRKEININHSKISTSLSNFPIVIDIVDIDLAIKAQSDGDDIVFIDENSDKLNHEVESYNSSDGGLITWVNVSSISSSSDTTLFMYYGNPDCENQEDVEGVWDSNFEAIWHLAETNGGPNAWKDSTGNGYDGTDENMNQSDPGTDFNASGRIDGAVQLDGSNDSINTSLYPGNGTRTLEFWANFDTLNGDSMMGCHDHANHRFYAGLRGSNAFFGVGNTASADVPINVSTGNWYYITIIVNESTACYYLNVEEITSFSYSQSGTSTLSLTIGYVNGNEHGFLNGFIDEVRVSYINRSEGWISTCFNNQNDSGSFYYIGNEETQVSEPHPPNEPINPQPEDSSKNITINPTLSVLVIDYDNDTMNVSFYDASDDSLIGIDNNVLNGSRAEVLWSDLQYDTEYEWYAIANDSIYENISDVWSFTTEKDSTLPPTISIIKPEEKRFYFRDKRLFRRLMTKSFIIGYITIEAEANDNKGIKQVEFYVDGKLKHTSTEPINDNKYTWTLNKRTLLFRHRHTITVTAVDTDDNTESDSVKVFIINFPILHPLRP